MLDKIVIILCQIVPDTLDSVFLSKIRKFARSCRYMLAYRLGLPCKAAIYAVKNIAHIKEFLKMYQWTLIDYEYIIINGIYSLICKYI